MAKSIKPLKIAYILGCFPDDTPTFVFNEIVGLSRLGLDITIFSIHKSVGNNNFLYYKRFISKTIYADPIYSLAIVFAHLYYLFIRPSVYLKLLLNFKAYGGKKAFWEGVFFSKKIKQLEINHVHAHFAWNAADVARIITRLTGIQYSLTAHQSDIYRTPVRLCEKVNESRLVMTCTKGNRGYLIEKYGKQLSAKTFSVYHGVNLDKFIPEEREEVKEIDILSIGDLIKIKGFEYLIKASAIVRENNAFIKCVIVGRGEERNNLQSLIEEKGLEDMIEIRNPVSYDEVVNLYRRSKIFVLPVNVINGAPHGIPNVLAEAMAMGMPVISSNIPNISELIEQGKDGMLVTEKDPKALANVIEDLLKNGIKRIAIGKMARKKIKKEFDARKHLQVLAELFGSIV